MTTSIRLGVASILATFAVLCLLAMPAQGQDTGGQVWGYSNFFYDPGSNQMLGYSETDLDYEYAFFYDAVVSATITDAQGAEYASQYNEDFSGAGMASAELSVDATLDVNFTFNAQHYANENEGGFEYLETTCGDEEGFTGLDYCNAETDGPPGEVDDELAAGNYGPCQITDEDNLRTEYATYGAAYTPGCDSFVHELVEDYFPYTFDIMVSLRSGTDNSSYPSSLYTDPISDWLILQSNEGDVGIPRINSDVDYNQPTGTPATPLSINGAFRTPMHNCADVYHGKTCQANSRHIYGDAIDFQVAVSGNSSSWFALANFIGNETDIGYACIEPGRASGYTHVHVDWGIQDTPAGSCNGFEITPNGPTAPITIN